MDLYQPKPRNLSDPASAHFLGGEHQIVPDPVQTQRAPERGLDLYVRTHLSAPVAVFR
jgi:hypothetical protein